MNLLPYLVTHLNIIPSLTLDLNIARGSSCLRYFHGIVGGDIIKNHVGLVELENTKVVEVVFVVMED